MMTEKATVTLRPDFRDFHPLHLRLWQKGVLPSGWKKETASLGLHSPWEKPCEYSGFLSPLVAS